MALMMLVPMLVACGGGENETTAPSVQTTAPTDNDEETGRNAIKDNAPTGALYGGETVTFFQRDNNDLYKYEIACEELLNDKLYDAIHYRNIDVETRLGVKIKTIGQPYTVGKAEWDNTLSTSVLTNTGDYDGAAIYASQSSPLAKDGIFLDLNTVSVEYGNGYIELSKPWWNQTLVNELTVYGALHFLAGDALITNTAQGYCLFFNKDMFNERFPDDKAAHLYSTVHDGKWTIDKLINYVSQVWSDSNSNGVIDDGDTMGWSARGGPADGGMDSWMYAMGLNVATMNEYGEPEISVIYDANTIPAYELVRKLHSGNDGAYGSSGLTAPLTDSIFENGKVLFIRHYLNAGSDFRESTVNYGVLPLPKYNEDQDDYRTIFCNNSSFFVLCSNLDEDRAEMMSAVLEVLAATSYKQVTPAYYSTVLQGMYSKDQPDAEMYDLILKSFVADFGLAYGTKSIGNINRLFRDVTTTFDIQSFIDSNKTAYDSALAELLLALEAIA